MPELVTCGGCGTINDLAHPTCKGCDGDLKGAVRLGVPPLSPPRFVPPKTNPGTGPSPLMSRRGSMGSAPVDAPVPTPTGRAGSRPKDPTTLRSAPTPPTAPTAPTPRGSARRRSHATRLGAPRKRTHLRARRPFRTGVFLIKLLGGIAFLVATAVLGSRPLDKAFGLELMVRTGMRSRRLPSFGRSLEIARHATQAPLLVAVGLLAALLPMAHMLGRTGHRRIRAWYVALSLVAAPGLVGLMFLHADEALGIEHDHLVNIVRGADRFDGAGSVAFEGNYAYVDNYNGVASTLDDVCWNRGDAAVLVLEKDLFGFEGLTLCSGGDYAGPNNSYGDLDLLEIDRTNTARRWTMPDTVGFLYRDYVGFVRELSSSRYEVGAAGFVGGVIWSVEISGPSVLDARFFGMPASAGRPVSEAERVARAEYAQSGAAAPHLPDKNTPAVVLTCGSGSTAGSMTVDLAAHSVPWRSCPGFTVT